MKNITGLKKRIIPNILVSNYQAVKSRNFSDYRTFGNLTQVVELFSRRKVDELVILDIESSKRNLPIDRRVLKLMTANSLIPITYGGGIKTLNDIENCLNTGCEKILLNSIMHENPKFLREAVSNFGSQSIIINIDIKNENGDYKIFNHSRNKIENKKISEFLNYCQEAECGEIILTSVDDDGMMNGYNLKILSEFKKLISRPLIMNGGCANPKHMKDILNNGADACMASSIFYFTRYSYKEIKDYLFNEKVNVRI